MIQMSTQPGYKIKIHLIDETYELFRHYFGAPKKISPGGREVGATVGLLRSLLTLLTRPGTTHATCAFDHVIESFRNTLYPGYKTGAEIDPDLLAQFPLAEEAVAALGVVVWPMVEFEADDAFATAAARFRDAQSVEQVLICSPFTGIPRLFRKQSAPGLLFSHPQGQKPRRRDLSRVGPPGHTGSGQFWPPKYAR